MAQTVSVKKVDETTYEVTVEGGTATTHVVTVPLAYAKRVSSDAPVEKLVRASFEFLLAREPNTSILRRFELSVIGQYFPEYEQEIGKYLT